MACSSFCLLIQPENKMSHTKLPFTAFAGELAWKNSHQPIDPKLYHGVHNTPLDSTLQKVGIIITDDNNNN